MVYVGPYILDGFDISTVPRGPICLALLRSQPDQASARAVSAIFGFSNSSFTKSSLFVFLARKLHWFPYLGQSDFYEPSVFTYRWSLRFVENVVLKREQWRLNCHLVPPTSIVYFIVWRMNLSKLSRNN